MLGNFVEINWAPGKSRVSSPRAFDACASFVNDARILAQDLTHIQHGYYALLTNFSFFSASNIGHMRVKSA